MRALEFIGLWAVVPFGSRFNPFVPNEGVGIEIHRLEL